MRTVLLSLGLLLLAGCATTAADDARWNRAMDSISVWGATPSYKNFVTCTPYGGGVVICR